ncbi:MAG: YggS family pyridoxal phosphate-dependent enzyme [Gemmatimonadetes bacterium]|nr:YggS family pyridoxal phosphate-dependent enzyme [Gemmatimonadota bacterium]MYK67292.1 YggS family pyridoxal phosphate-dependent enzyme [Gemmatimonadota bacterium]
MNDQDRVVKERYARTLRDRLPGVRDVIAAAAARSGRDPSAVRIVAVTKGHPVNAVLAVTEAGLRDLGENRVEELDNKMGFLGDIVVEDQDWAYPRDTRWHMIGHVQRRKAVLAARLASLIHSVDSLRLAEKLSRFGEKLGRKVLPPISVNQDRVPVLVQVNASGEATKGGFPVVEAVDAVGRIAELPGLRVQGLMTMAPFTGEEAVLRSTFAKVREVMEAAAVLPGVEGCELSMGMSNDYGLAVEEGSTMVRLGTTLLGPRP